MSNNKSRTISRIHAGINVSLKTIKDNDITISDIDETNGLINKKTMSYIKINSKITSNASESNDDLEYLRQRVEQLEMALIVEKKINKQQHETIKQLIKLNESKNKEPSIQIIPKQETTEPENRLHPDSKDGEPVKILRETSLVNDTLVKKPNESNGKRWDGYAMEYKPKEKDPFISDDEE
jgi:hypothetical protein